MDDPTNIYIYGLVNIWSLYDIWLLYGYDMVIIWLLHGYYMVIENGMNMACFIGF